MERLVLASKNKGKLKELRQILAGLPVEPVALDEHPGTPGVEEDADTFVGNAVKKASVVARYTGHIALADDSGLEVDALGGRPGVHSARFAGVHGNDEANNRLLLERMADVPDEQRSARFRCAIAIVFPDGRIYTAEGSCEGMVTRTPRGQGGFGYDPLFYLPEQGLTMAELPEAEKNRVSHRARAMQGAAEILKDVLAGPGLEAGGPA